MRSPAGYALAVHHDHPGLRRAPEPPRRDAGTAFAGLYVRHPLTGDLLPVWVADWVKPDFGTGAVLVNPAHDSVDLEFGRRIGLPIRFALDEQPDSDAPDPWQTPPVIQRGRTGKTGLHDGLDVATARQRYFDVRGGARVGLRAYRRPAAVTGARVARTGSLRRLAVR